MRHLTVTSWTLVVASAVLQILMFPTGGPLAEWRTALCWIALTPLFSALCLSDRRGRPLTPGTAALLGYLCGILWYLGNCCWIFETMHLYGGLSKPVSIAILVLFSLYLGIYHALFAWLLACLMRSRLGVRGALLAAPVLWVAVELARSRITCFPWDLLGYTQVNNLLLTRLAPVGGVMALSLVIAAVNAAIAYGLVAPRRQRVRLVVAGLAVGLVLQVAGQVGSLRKNYTATTNASAVMLQENLEVGAVGRGSAPLSTADEMRQFTELSLHPSSSGARGNGAAEITPDQKQAVVVWPEAPSHFQSNDPSFRSGISEVARRSGAAVIAGSLGVELTPVAPRGYYLYDSATLFEPTGEYVARYDKIHLVPWGEYIPFKEFFSFAQKLTEGVGDMDRGYRRDVFRSGGHAYGVFICYESIFGDEVRQFVQNGAEVLVNISDDGWYGNSGAPWQHLNMARMRAIENDRWILRDTNTGVTTAIDPQGRMAFQAPRHVRAAYTFAFGYAQGQTFYTRHGDWLAFLCAAASAGLVAMSLLTAKAAKLN